jgi:hypothetical protein
MRAPSSLRASGLLGRGPLRSTLVLGSADTSSASGTPAVGAFFISPKMWSVEVRDEDGADPGGVDSAACMLAWSLPAVGCH